MKRMIKRTGKQNVYASMAVLAGAAALCMTGCADGTIEVKTDAFSIELGETVSDRPQDYVTASSRSMYEEMSVDLSGVDETRAGSYEAGITYKEERYTVMFEIKDTTPPEIEAAGYLVSQPGKITAGQLITKASDLSGYELYIVSAEKEAELEETAAEKQELEALQAETSVKQGFDAADLKDSVTLSEEGAYLVTCAAADEYGNAAHAQVHVYIDGTVPEILTEDQEIIIDASGFSTEADTLDAIMEELHALAGDMAGKLEADASDNFLVDTGNLTSTIGEGEVSLDGEDVTETLKAAYSLADEAGNAAEKEITLTVVYEGAESRKIGIQTGLIEEEMPQTTESKNGSGSNKGSSAQNGATAAGSNTSSAQNQGAGTASSEELTAEEIREMMESWGDNWWENIDFDIDESDIEDVQLSIDIGYEGYNSEWGRIIFNMINEERAAAGLNQLAWNEELASLADGRSVAISTDFQHYPVFTQSGVKCGENIAKVFVPSADNSYASTIHESFKYSEGHYNNYMAENRTEGAVSVYFAPDGMVYCVELFLI